MPETDRNRNTSQLMEHSASLLYDSGLVTRETYYLKKPRMIHNIFREPTL